VAENLLEIRGLRTHFNTEEGLVKAVDGVDLTIAKGETLGVVGESGCGKSVTAMSILKLNPEPPAVYPAGEIRFNGRDLMRLSEAEMRKVRGNDIAMIFQEPMTSLNPVYTVGDQITEALELHRGMAPKEAWDYAIEMLRKVGIPSPDVRVAEFPHEMSGGMKQRVMIAMALACRPRILVADEPTTALDVTIQAEIMRLLRALKETTDMSIVLITHNFAIVKDFADRAIVMHQGRIVEQGDVKDVLENPTHAYTRELIACIPRLGAKRRRLPTIDREALREAAEASP
jgi:ABC-type dipeptide/oligopeptide/nickel transport system ATPase component